ncbi:hypothetical protein KXV70_006194 [Aspergillus fumigatus]|nr:hypothetical protein KXX54_005784 [Aspergillus fumigatus]KAH2463747.1 hypothetical protein KXV71_003845 [Aspergillus fumigatus]KAH2565830.1 hypothetical protein KXV70_006194 [Aspergillus fumigatus]KAH2799960.1 hypothetical protein KXW38_007166 [Aspergillus fumigatus]KAH2871165.1 hypothetical protein KXV67_002186 [Aspergillus fumigatus]
MQDNKILKSLDSKSHKSNSRLSVLRPDTINGWTRDLKPSDDDAPFAHEPAGLGTLRDVREEKFYKGGTATLSPVNGSLQIEPAIYDPYPEYNSAEWRRFWKGRQHFPFPMYGSYDALGLDGFSCMDRYTRFGAYGYSGTDSQLQGARPLPPVDWKKVNWRTLQEDCFERNSDRYESAKQSLSMHSLPLTSVSHETLPRYSRLDQSLPQFKPRSAVILRAWHDMPWTENMKHYVRSLVMELSLHTGSEYQVFILTHVKDNNIPIYAVNGDDNAQRLKEKYMPKEFHDMTILFNDHTLESWYPAIEEHRPQYQHLQPLQIFSQVFSDFDYYWQLEMDSRISGHSYHFFEKAADFARNQPRKYLWERNAYFYIPGAHGTWEEFMKMVESSMKDKESIWGPTPPDSKLTPIGPRPPVAHPRDDHYEWGVGEEADLMLFLPIFDPIDTKWTYPTMIWNLSERDPRRAAPITMGRYSKTLMDAIHSAQVGQGIGLASEMTAPSFALWHGLKAVQVPHPIYSDGKWTPKELNRIVNKGSPEKMNGGPDSIWNWNHEYDHILFRTSYMFTTQTAEDLYRRWLGYVVDPHQYTDGSYHQDPQGRNWFDNGDLREDLYGRLCLPNMFLHTIKNTAPKKGREMAVPV